MGRFHHRVSQRLTGTQSLQGRDGVWVYPPLEYMMVEEGLQEVETYIFRCLNMVAQFIATRTVMFYES